jgi:hypothetical protein
MPSIDHGKTVYLIVHGQNQYLSLLKEKLAFKGFERQKMQTASLEKVGNIGEYVAMIWPPVNPKEIVVSMIGGIKEEDGMGKGAWASIHQDELFRIPLT